MYRNIYNFITDWKNETEGTVKVFSLITEETRQVKIHEHVRSLERLAWHLTQTITEMGHKAGLFPVDHLENSPTPESISELVSTYQDYCEQLSKAVNSKWTNSSLEDKVNMYGEEWEKGKILQVLIIHQTHHRGQMTVIMRMLGLPVPGIYGPSKEEWANMGMQAME
ncbi:DinB family protein [Arcticibacter eurypsychrophilus]|uniref:DinB family protein n=1 Tax=Arcticibacter eurypsychrophilus TaxID=1434752 RepID=UPI00084DB2D5|nr:DinB family protein [Arcticibacter eurypsychrophilus]